jgi:hypothetical protein
MRIYLASACAILMAGTAAPVLAQSHDGHSVPDLNANWARDVHNYPKPYLERGVIKDGYNNEYLKPWVVELLERDELVTASDQTVVTAHSVCYPESVPYSYGGTQVNILQTEDEITMLFGDQGQWRTIHLNRPHPEHVEPSWWGDSVGHFEGDTLVIDTVGIAVKPQSGSMGRYGTPHSDMLHLVERWRFLREGEESMAPPAKNDSFDASAVVDDGRVMRLEFTMEDPIAYHKPWSVTLDYLELDARVREFACAENSRFWDLAPLIPHSPTPDF